MIARRPNLFFRPDTLFGLCEGLGQETGVSPLLYRLAFALPLIFAPAAVIAAYLTLGVSLMILRWLVPVTTPAQPALLPPIEQAAMLQAENDDAVLARAA